MEHSVYLHTYLNTIPFLPVLLRIDHPHKLSNCSFLPPDSRLDICSSNVRSIPMAFSNCFTPACFFGISKVHLYSNSAVSPQVLQTIFDSAFYIWHPIASVTYSPDYVDQTLRLQYPSTLQYSILYTRLLVYLQFLVLL